ncbi:MAG: leucine--tRNA ligase [Planctomycetota bacterium]|jgi:leucyl-tRNA synthetase
MTETTRTTATSEPAPAGRDEERPFRYDGALANAIESRWQERWERDATFRTPGPGDPDFDPSHPKFYVLDMFPYPSGVGLHVGHPLGYIATDIIARYKRLRGFNVLHPMGFDAFGLPAEQFAVERGVHPRITTEQNVENMVRQLKTLGLGYDWRRRVATTDPDYYRWTQWIFLQMFNSWFDPAGGVARPVADLVRGLEDGTMVVAPGGDPVPAAEAGPEARRWGDLDEQAREAVLDGQRLAYMAELPVNWCPALGTVLANEEVTNEGRSERGNHPVYKRPLKQWMLRITAYAERLADDLDLVDWPEAIKSMQRNWIGRSEGASIGFALDGHDETIRVFTTRPDTLFGATYMVLAPEHPLVERVTTAEHRDAVSRYRSEAEARSDIDRMAETKTKTGVFTGAFAVNPATGERVPVWIADYVLWGYGTGAIMAVPAHDLRDWAFARQFDLPIRTVVKPPAGYRPTEEEAALAVEADGRSEVPFAGEGTAVSSTNDEVSLDGADTPEAKRRIIAWLEGRGFGAARVQYKLRDWLFSRQRYWGEPFPILHDRDGRTIAVDESELPVTLPEMEDFTPEASTDPDTAPRPPLSRAPESWRVVERDGKRYERELNTMPQWAGSCWYYLRFIDPGNDDTLVGHDAESYWMGEKGIDLYVGGVEHAVLHLLYARFWHKVLFDLGRVSTPEPFGRLFNQGYIQAYAYRDERGIAVPAEEVVDQDGAPATEVQDQPNRRFFHDGQPVTQEYGKMGKSLKNAVSPDEVREEYGCDALRLYEMYLGPLDASKAWSTRDIKGLSRFLQRLWRLMVDEQTGSLVLRDAADVDVEKLLHRTIAKVGDDIDRMAFNTAIAAMIEFVNAATGTGLTRDQVGRFAIILGPFAPHLAEEIWSKLGHDASVAAASWPEVDAAMLADDTIELPVQILGKVRGKISVPADADPKAVETAALADEQRSEHAGW